jgi:hypothetical protein
MKLEKLRQKRTNNILPSFERDKKAKMLVKNKKKS